MRHRFAQGTAFLAALVFVGCATDAPPSAEVRLTWLSNTTWYVEAGDVRIFVDAALTRWTFARPDFARPESFAPAPVVSDTALVHEVLGAVGAEEGAAYILVGHGHADHTIDLAEFARFTGAEVIGSRTVCFEAEAQGLPSGRCRRVEGGERLALGSDLDVQVIRWTHSGDPDNRLGRFLQAPKELHEAPSVDPETGGIGQAPWHGYPNGGGVRAYLFRYVTGRDTLTWLISDSGNPFTFDSIPQIGSDYLADVGVDLSNLEFPVPVGAPRAWLARAVEAAGIDSIDLWIGYGDVRHVEQVHGLLPFRYFVPHHWDPYMAGFRPGLSRPFQRPALGDYLDGVGVRMMPQSQYMQRYLLTPDSMRVLPSDALQQRLGLVAR